MTLLSQKRRSLHKVVAHLNNFLISIKQYIFMLYSLYKKIFQKKKIDNGSERDIIAHN